ncbi:MAG: hypothetical protein JST79_07565 [Acidobacteria bacterium]|nr:hypothetical protein [Acidobacteriota bacterium]
MKAKILLATLVFGAVTTLTTMGFAAEKAPLRLAQTVNAGGKSLPEGSYTVTWEGSGPNVELQFLKGKQVVATVPAQIVSLEKATNQNSVITHDGGNGAPTLTQILFAGKKYALQIGDSAQQSASSK